MTKEAAQKKLEKAGYTVIFCRSGAIIARKWERSYQAYSLEGLIKQIF
jgi:hypothetical protein